MRQRPLRLETLGPLVCLTGAILFMDETTARGQGHTPDPYNIVGEYNNQYEPFMYASEPSAEGTLPNQNRMERRSRSRMASDYEDDRSEFDARFDEPDDYGRRRGRSSRYGSSNDPRATPATETEDNYYANQRKRTQDYFRALAVKDPKKRAKLLRELNLETLRVSRMLPNNRSQAAALRNRTLRFDMVGEDSEEDEAATAAGSRSRSTALKKGNTADRRSIVNIDEEDDLPVGESRSRSNLDSVTGSRRSNGTAATAKGALRTNPSGSAARSNSAVEDILQRSERLDSERRRSTNTTTNGRRSTNPNR